MKTSSVVLAMMASSFLGTSALEVTPVAIESEKSVSTACIALCSKINSEEKPFEVCKSLFNDRPKPQCWNFCTYGMDTAFSETCMPMCMTVGHTALVDKGLEGIAEFVDKPKMATNIACNADSKPEHPRQVFRKYCRIGYNGGFDATIKMVTSYAETLFGLDDKSDSLQTELAKEEKAKRQAAEHAKNLEQTILQEKEKAEKLKAELESSTKNAERLEKLKQREARAAQVETARLAREAAEKAAGEEEVSVEKATDEAATPKTSTEGGGLRKAVKEPDHVPPAVEATAATEGAPAKDQV